MIKKNLVVLIVAIFAVILVSSISFLVFSGNRDNLSVAKKEANITVNFPRAGTTVGKHLIVSGSARVFENQFDWSVLDANSRKEIVSGTAYANAQDAGLFGGFEINTILPDYDTDKIILQVFDRSPKDGSVIDLVKVPLNFNKNMNDAYQVYFSNKNLDPETTCIKVFPVIRSAGTEKLTLRGALDELLKGLTDEEKNNGYFNSIPENVKINFIQDEGSIVKVDFSKDLENGVAGSCRVTAIKAQIYWTVINFDRNARSVVISVDGNAESALQP